MPNQIDPGNQLETPSYVFAGDPALWYDVGVWGDRGYGVPNPGVNYDTVNETLANYINDAGKMISAIMHNPNTAISDPPPWNDMERMIKFGNYARQVLVTDAVAENEPKFEGKNVTSQRLPFKVYPCPCFQVQNRVFRDFVFEGFTMLAELMQTPLIVTPWDITEELATLALSYVRRWQRRIGGRYFGLAPDVINDPNLNLLDHQASYTPRAHGVPDTETLDIIYARQLSLPQPRELGPLASGILVRDLPKDISPYPYSQQFNYGTGNVVGDDKQNVVDTTGGTNVPPFPE